jgi:heme-degrading monooxygenase HmoA
MVPVERGGGLCYLKLQLRRGFAAAIGVKMIVALSRFTIANEMSDEVRAAFRSRPHLVDDAPGFLGLEVMSPVDARAEIWLVTRWRDEQAYRTWHRGHQYHDSHKGIPKGLKLVQGSASVQIFEVFAD